MGPLTKRLTEVLREMAQLLDRYDERHWAGWIKRDLEAIDRLDFWGVEHFLRAFGGMGSLNDVFICPANGHSIAESEMELVNEEFRRLKGEAWKLAREIRAVAER